MSGIRLSKMEASDMLDVLHYLFEEDNSYFSEEHMRSKEELRRVVYESLYGVEYKYKLAKDPTKSRNYVEDDLDNFDDEDDLTPFDPLKAPTKAYLPPTPFNPDSAKPFGTILDPPMGI